MAVPESTFSNGLTGEVDGRGFSQYFFFNTGRYLALIGVDLTLRESMTLTE
jgi:hypothetical protein